MWVRLSVGGSAHQGYGKKQVETLMREGGSCSYWAPSFLFAQDSLPIPPHLYQLKSVWELEKVKELNLEELWLEGNPFCNHFMDQSDYVRYITPAKSFPLHCQCHGFVSCCCDEIHCPKQRKGETAYLAYSCRLQFLITSELRWQELEATDHITSTVKKREQ